MLTIEVKDGRDAFLDSGLLIRDGFIPTPSSGRTSRFASPPAE
ncbi:hypothetical protein AB5I41_09050 [Sphingomonas sp. MMS24-JH45]